VGFFKKSILVLPIRSGNFSRNFQYEGEEDANKRSVKEPNERSSETMFRGAGACPSRSCQRNKTGSISPFQDPIVPISCFFVLRNFPFGY
jgi:hypothetical protein